MPKETAEEKLLKMMQKPGSANPSPASAKPSRKSFVFSMRLLNRLLMLGILACAAGLVYEVRQGQDMLSREVDFGLGGKAPRAVAQAALPGSKDVGYYLDQINSRNIFRPYEPPAGKAAGGAYTLAKRLSKYKMVGVAWLDLPQTASVMIEDTGNGATYFLKQGEQLDGVTVKTIYTDRAVFGYENEETTIKL